jgi:hypothetical protein
VQQPSHRRGTSKRARSRIPRRTSVQEDCGRRSSSRWSPDPLRTDGMCSRSRRSRRAARLTGFVALTPIHEDRPRAHRRVTLSAFPWRRSCARRRTVPCKRREFGGRFQAPKAPSGFEPLYSSNRRDAGDSGWTRPEWPSRQKQARLAACRRGPAADEEAGVQLAARPPAVTACRGRGGPDALKASTSLAACTPAGEPSRPAASRESRSACTSETRRFA